MGVLRVRTFALFYLILVINDNHYCSLSENTSRIPVNEIGEFAMGFLKRCQWSKTVILTNDGETAGHIIRRFSMKTIQVALLSLNVNNNAILSSFNSVVVIANARAALDFISKVLQMQYFLPQNWLVISDDDLIESDVLFVPHDFNIIHATTRLNKENQIELLRFYTGQNEVLKKSVLGYWKVGGKLQNIKLEPIALPILQGNVVRVTTVSFPPHYAPHLLQPPDGKEPSGIYGEILQILKMKINITCAVNPPKDGNFGNIMNSSHYSGMVGLLISNESDVSVAISMTTDRTSVIDYSHTITKSTVDFVFRNREDKRWRFLFFLEPFPKRLWTAIIVILLIVAILFSMIKKFTVAHDNQEIVPRGLLTNKKRSTTFTNFLWSVQISYYTLLGKGYDLCVSGSTVKIVLQVFHLFSLVILVQYSSVLTSLLTVTNNPIPFESLGELLDKSDYGVGTLSGTSIVEVYKFATCGVNAGVWQRMNKNLDLYLTQNISDGLDLAYAENYAFIMEKTVLASMMRGNCSLQFGERSAYHVLSAFGYRKGFRYRKIFDKYLRLMIESGVVKKIEEKYTPPDHNKPCELKGWKMGLDRYSVIGIFLLMMFAVLASLLTLLLEMLIHSRYF